MESTKAAQSILDALMAGSLASEFRPLIASFSEAKRQALLCTLCALHEEIAAISGAHSDQVDSLRDLACEHNRGERQACAFLKAMRSTAPNRSET
jgi:hypothetical protein